jgi:hypothetical protein
VISFLVSKLEWEKGVEFGQVFYPENITELQTKIEELHQWARNRHYPFLIAITFIDESLYLGFTIGHQYSLIEFICDIDRTKKTWNGPFYLKNSEGKSNEIIPISYRGTYTESDTTKMLPQAQVLDAVYTFIQQGVFPVFIQLDDDDINHRFIHH